VLNDPKVPAAKQLSAPALDSPIAALVEHLIDALLHHRPFALPDESKRAPAWGGGAKTAAVLEHARSRIAVQYSLVQALRELSHLRATIVDLCFQNGVGIEQGDLKFIHEAIDDAMSTTAAEMERAARQDQELKRQWLHSILQLLPVAVQITDANGRLIHTNAASASLWGKAASILHDISEFGTYRGWLGTIGSSIAPEAWSTSAARFMGEESRTEEVDILTFDGKRKTILNSALPLRDASGAIVGYVAVDVDITARAEASRDLRRNVAFRDMFAGILGHDLRNPLTSITFASALLLKRDDLPDAVTKTMRRIATSADRMARMISDLLDVTRSRVAGGMPIERKPADLHAICRNVIDELEAAHPARTVQFTTLGSGHGVLDPDRLAQVVSNLVSNALDYSPGGTPVHVAVRGDDPTLLELEVNNLGTPIPPEVLETIFDPFRRGPGAAGSRRTSKGLGLGLFIAQQIVEAHGGSIRATSMLEQGTTLTVSLPRAPR
jgi:signal transduction histidine kinase